MQNKKIIAVAGVPASGKSSLIIELLNRLSGGISNKKYKNLDYLQAIEYPICILGRYDTIDFPGTDRLSFAVQPTAIEFVNSSQNNIIFEGDRLTNRSFFESVQDKICIILESSNIEVRRNLRSKRMSDKFLRSKETKIKNLKKLPYSIVRQNNTIEDRNAIVSEILIEVLGG